MILGHLDQLVHLLDTRLLVTVLSLSIHTGSGVIAAEGDGEVV